MSSTTDFRRLLIVLLIALIVRLALIVPGLGRLNDPDNYLPLARSLAEGRGFSLEDGRPTAYRPPLYPMILAPLVATLGKHLPLGIAGLHLALSLGMVSLTFFTARRWNFDTKRAMIAALIVAIDPVTIVQSRSVMTETFAAFLVAMTLAALTVPGRRGLILGGIGFGLTALCRPSLMPWAWLYGVVIVVSGSEPFFRRMGHLLIFSMAMTVPLLPWALRNAYRFGEPIWTTTHGGYTLALANNSAYYADVLDGPPGAVWSGANQTAWFETITEKTAGMTHLEADRYLRNQGLRMLIDRPIAFLRASLARLRRFWGIAPSGWVYPQWLRIATAVWTIPLWVALTLGLLRRELWSRPQVSAPLVLMALTVVHALFWTDMRMRVPMISAIALIAAGALPWWSKATSIELSHESTSSGKKGVSRVAL